MQNGLSHLVRVAQSLVLFTIAAAMVWLGAQQISMESPSVLPSMMCMGFAFVLMLTAIMVYLDDAQSDAYEAE
jgi:hypothetical protein